MGLRDFLLTINLILFAVVPTVIATEAAAQAPSPPKQNPSAQPSGTPAPRKFQDRPLTPQEIDRNFEDMNKASGVRLYEGLCTRAKDFAAKKGANFDPLLSQFNTIVGNDVTNALLDFCATGRFVLNFYDRDRKCTNRVTLTPAHVGLIKRLPFVRPGESEIIALACVEVTEPIVLLNLRANAVLIQDTELAGIEINGGALSSTFSMTNTTVNGWTNIFGMTIGSSVEIRRSTLGKAGNKSTALEISKSALGTIEISDVQVNGNALIADNQLKGYAQIGLVKTEADAKPDIRVTGNFDMGRNDIKGYLRVTNAQFDGALDLRTNFVERAFYVGGNTTIKDTLDLFGSRALSMELYGLEVQEDVYAVAVRVTETLYVGNGSAGNEKANFKKSVQFRNLKADRLRIHSTTIGESLTLTGMTSNDVVMLDVILGKQLYSGNARARTMDIRASTIPQLDCTDCEITQYLLLGGKFSELVNLRGAQIRASLVFRDGDGDRNGSTWGPKSHLDLRNLQVETIEADLCDLRVTPESGDKCSGAMVPTQINGAKFRNFLPGRRPNVLGMTDGLLDQKANTIISWIRTSLGGGEFHPQPYELIADALDRAGRNRTATEVRIAKLDDDYATGNYSLIRTLLAKGGRIFVRYGYHNEYGIIWFGALIFIGMLFFVFGRRVSKVNVHELRLGGLWNLIWYSFWFSIDRAVPPLHVDEQMKEYSVLTTFSRSYFYFHRGVGMVILSFIVAGIAGLFK